MRKIYVLLLCALFLLPQAANAEDFEDFIFPDFFVRVSTAQYEERDWLAPIYFNYPSGVPTEYYVAGEKRETDLPILLEQGRTMLPLRLVGEACGAAVDWDNAQKQVTVCLNGQSASVRLGQTELLVNGKSLSMDVAPRVVNNVVYLPLRFLGEALGKEVCYCNRLEQGFVVVCEAGRADYSERRQFNQLMQRTYLDDFDEIWDIGRANVITAGNDYLQINGSNMFEHSFLSEGGFSSAAQIEEKTGCMLVSELMPANTSYKVIAFYADGELLAKYRDEDPYMAHNYTDVRILWDGKPGWVLYDGFVCGDYWYAVEDYQGLEAVSSRLFRVDLTTSAQKYFTPEYLLSGSAYEYGKPLAYGEPYLVMTEESLYAYGRSNAGEVAGCWFEINLDTKACKMVDKLPPKEEWLHYAS